MVGSSDLPGGAIHPFVYVSGVEKDLGIEGNANAVNAWGLVVGQARLSGTAYVLLGSRVEVFPTQSGP